MLARALHLPAHMRRLCLLGNIGGAKTALLLCRWKYYHFLFLLVRCVMEADRWFMVIVFPFSFLSFPLKSTRWPSLILIFQFQSSFFWFLIFVLSTFIKILFVFNLSFFFSIRPLFFRLLILFLYLFVKVLLVFNCIL